MTATPLFAAARRARALSSARGRQVWIWVQGGALYLGLAYRPGPNCRLLYIVAGATVTRIR